MNGTAHDAWMAVAKSPLSTTRVFRDRTSKTDTAAGARARQPRGDEAFVLEHREKPGVREEGEEAGRHRQAERRLSKVLA